MYLEMMWQTGTLQWFLSVCNDVMDCYITVVQWCDRLLHYSGQWCDRLVHYSCSYLFAMMWWTVTLQWFNDVTVWYMTVVLICLQWCDGLLHYSGQWCDRLVHYITLWFLSVCSEDWTVYIGSHSHQFIALSVSSGVALWQTRLGDRIESSAALSMCRCLLVVGEQTV